MFDPIKQLINPYLPCQLCHTHPRHNQAPICQACKQDLPWQQEQFEIQDHHIQTICRYDWPIDQLIHQFKYQQQTDKLALLGYLLLQAHKPNVHAIVAVPISRQRLIERGFNQTLLLAQYISKHWQIPVWQPLEKQHRPAQQGLDQAERLGNLQGAFFPKAMQQRITPRRVLLIDDVVTTGSTLLQLTQALQSLGVHDCQSLVLARAT